MNKSPRNTGAFVSKRFNIEIINKKCYDSKTLRDRLMVGHGPLKASI